MNATFALDLHCFTFVCCQMKFISKFTLQIECTTNSCETNHFGEHLNKWQNYVCNAFKTSIRLHAALEIVAKHILSALSPLLYCLFSSSLGLLSFKKRLETLRLWKFLSHAQRKTLKLHCSGIAYIVCRSLTR